MDEDLSETLDAIGGRLRALRLRSDTTLTQLSASTGISVSTLSRLESGQRRASLELLLPLARVHGVALDDLVAAPTTADPRVHLRPVQMHDMTVIPLSQRRGGLQAYKMLIPSRGNPERPVLQTHDGHEWFYVLDGRLRLILGDQDLVLGPGEAAEFDARTPHWNGSADAHPVEILALVGKQGERAHLRS